MSKITEMLAKTTGLASSEVANVLQSLGSEELGRVQGAGPCENFTGATTPGSKVRSIICA